MSKPDLARAIEHLNAWATEQAWDGPVTQEELDGIVMAIAELQRFLEASPSSAE